MLVATRAIAARGSRASPLMMLRMRCSRSGFMSFCFWSPLPPGEGQGEGVFGVQVARFSNAPSPQPSPKGRGGNAAQPFIIAGHERDPLARQSLQVESFHHLAQLDRLMLADP